MVRLLMKNITKLLNNRSNIRNISIVGLSDDGTEPLTDNLLASSGITVADNFPPYAPWVECSLGELTVDPACVSLYASTGDKCDDDELSNQYVVNVILNDNPNGMHEMKIADGTIIVVDSDRVSADTQTFIQNAINEKLKIILFINNVDINLLTVTESNLECIYRELERTIHAIECLIQQYTNDKLYSIDVMSNIVFGCVEKGWAFNLLSFAGIYSESFSKLNSKSLADKLWADHFYSFTERKWSNVKRNDTYMRSFVRFVLEPIHKVYRAIFDNNRTEIDNIIAKLKIHLRDYEKEKCGEVLLRKIMKEWCPISNCLLPLVISHFPSPVVAQRYRHDVIYNGGDQKIIDLIKRDQGDGNFVMKITKTLRTNDHGRRYAFGRILSGKLNKGDRVRVISDQGTFEKKEVDKIFFLSGRFVDEITETFSGSICAVSGFDSCIDRVAILTAE